MKGIILEKTPRGPYLQVKRIAFRVIVAVVLLQIAIGNLMPMAVANASTKETAVSPEAVKNSFNNKLILQLDKAYYLKTNQAIPGEENIIKETDTCSVSFGGRTMVPVRLISENLGANVNWEAASQTIAITKDNTVITLQPGNKVMSINTGGKVEQMTLDVPSQVNKDGRTLVPVRAVSEAFKIPVQWNEEQRMVLIGYTAEEAASLGNHEAIDLEVAHKASQFMAGGEYMNVAEEGPFAIKEKQSGAVVVFSDEDFLKIDKTISLIERSKCNAEELHQKYLDKSIIFNIKDKLNSNDCVYVLNGEAYVFNDENLKQGKTLIKYDAYGNPSTITNDKAGDFYFPRLAFDKKLGICLHDGTKITHKLNTQTKQFDELPTPEFVGTLEQRTIHNLEAAHNAKWSDGSNTNPLGLDYQDILEYKNTGSDANCKSFKLIKVSDNLGFICITGGRCGLKNEDSLKTLEIVLQKCNKIDPAISQNWVENGLVFFTNEESACNFFTREDRKNWISAVLLTEYGGSIYLNEGNPNISKKNQYLFLKVITGESFGLKCQRQFSNRKTVDEGVVYEDAEVYKDVKWEKFLEKYFPGEWDWFNLQKK